jgi:hypothetical protein
MAEPEGATALGRYLYLFKSSTNSTDCVISAHGGYMFENRDFTVPEGITLRFLGEHGASLIDPTIDDFFRNQGDAISVETISGGQKCRNYLLSKYQGAHAGKSGTEVVETYGQINQRVDVTDKQRQKNFNQMLRAANVQGGDANVVKMQLEHLDRARGGSVLTIRNRWDVVFGIPLQDALKAAKKEMPTLREFYCLFCRSYMLGDDPKAAQNVQYRPPT